MTNHLIPITKSDGTTQLFEEEKLVQSLRRVGAAPEVVDDIVDEIERNMKPGMSTADIYNRAFALLKTHSMPVAVKYSVRRGMMELGPDGFPFERFVARIFKMWGYDTVTDQAVMGSCVSHEIDVVAWKGTDLVMVEAKYHNEFGMKTDLKVALYVKARYDDIAGIDYDYGGIRRKLTERWLITNTKFTDKAITYAGCNNIKLLGWNYPLEGSLHEIIGRNGLHPITSLSTLTRDQKKDLIGRNILTCIDIIADPTILDHIGVKEPTKEQVLTELQIVIEQAK